MLLCPHVGAPPRALQRGASGGELSRVMLAVEVVLAGADPVPTLVFDEVDAGVGGRAAVEVGSRLAALARTAQVLVVTHLPQVAAFADQHLVVRKASDGAVTRSGVTCARRGRAGCWSSPGCWPGSRRPMLPRPTPRSCSTWPGPPRPAELAGAGESTEPGREEPSRPSADSGTQLGTG